MELNLCEGVTLPMVGFGTYLIPDDVAQASVLQALRAGYRHIDTAELYHNERGVGLGLQDGLRELGLSRDDVFVTTKLWPGKAEWGDSEKTYQTTIESLNTSLKKLQLDYVDLYLIHAPLSPANRLEQWKALVELQSTGKTRSIGVSNYGIKHLEEIKAAGLPTPDANQLELHPWSQQSELIVYLAENDIAVIAYSSLAPLSTWRVDPGQGSAKTESTAQSDASFKQLGEKYGVTAAQVLLKWALQKGYAILPKSTKEARIRENIDLFSFEITAEDMAAIEAMDQDKPLAWPSGDPTTFA